MTGPAATPRTAGRMFVVDSEERLLLVHERRDIGSAESIWITPGGGVEDGESVVAAAVREVFEETGLWIPLPASARPVYTERVTFGLAGRVFDQTNHYFLARVPTGVAIEPAAHTEIERLLVLGHRWWTMAELAASDALREPLAMVEVVQHALAGE